MPEASGEIIKFQKHPNRSSEADFLFRTLDYTNSWLRINLTCGFWSFISFGFSHRDKTIFSLFKRYLKGQRDPHTYK